MMEIIGPIALVVLLIVFFYYFDGWYAYLDDKRKPPVPYQDEQQLIGRTGTVVQAFEPSGGSQLRVGKVEVNGVTWSAQTADESLSLDLGDKVAVVSRDSLTLTVAERAAT